MLKTGKIIKFVSCIALLFTSLHATAPTIVDSNFGKTVRYLYWIMNGPPTSGYPTGLSGPANGILGFVRDMTGMSRLGGGLYKAGYKTCSELPLSGNVSIRDESINLDYVVTFNTPSRSILTGYTGAGGTFEKSMNVSWNGATFLRMEFNCSNQVGWIRFADPYRISQGDNFNYVRNIEAWWDTTSVASTKLDLAMFYADSDRTNHEFVMAKFRTTSETRYQYWATRATWPRSGAGKEGFRLAVSGNTSTRMAKVFMFYQSNGAYDDASTTLNDNDNIYSGGDVECIGFVKDANPSSQGVSNCSSMTLSSPGAPFFDAGGDFSINYVSAALGMKSHLTTL